MSTPLQSPRPTPEPAVPSDAAAPATAGPPPAGPGVTAWRVAGGVLAAVLVAGAAVSAVSTVTQQRASATTTWQQPLTKVVVDTGTGSVVLRAGAAGSPVVVQRQTRWSLGGVPDVEESAAGQVLTLRGSCRGLWLCAVGYTVTVPPGVDVDVSTSTGSIEAAGLDGDLQVATSTGSIELTGLRSDRVDADASTGSVELRFAEAPQDVRADTSTGSVEVVVPADGTAYAVQTDTGVGSTEIGVPVDSSSSRRIDARASTGSVEVRTAS